MFDTEGLLKEEPTGPAERRPARPGTLESYVASGEVPKGPLSGIHDDTEEAMAVAIKARSDAPLTEEEILAKAIPAAAFGSDMFRRKPSMPQPQPFNRGNKVWHKPSGKRVTIVEANARVTGSGEIQHKVMMAGSKKKFLVVESKLSKDKP